MLTEAQATDAAEDRLYGLEQRGDELPEALRDRRSRLARLQACQELLTQEAATATVQQQAKIEAAAEATAKANVTDPESRIMQTQGGYVQGDNAQAIVTEAQIILAAAATQEENDVRQLHPMLTEVKENLQAITTALADAGYCSEANLTEADPAGPGRTRPLDGHEQGLETAPSAAGAAAATRPLSEGADGPRPHGAHTADDARAPSVQETRPDGRAGVRTDQEHPWL